MIPQAPEDLAVLDPESAFGPVADVKNDDLTEDDMMSLVVAALRANPPISHNIKGFDELMEHGISKIVTQSFMIDIVVKNQRLQGNAGIDYFDIKVKFTDAGVGRPTRSVYPNGEMADLYPNEALNSGTVYSAPLMLGAKIELVAHFKDGRTEARGAKLEPFEVSRIPIMVRCNRCHTRNMTREALKIVKEDPTDHGGHFIAGGSEYVVELLENIRFGSLHVHPHMRPNEIVRGEFISQPGGAFENSSQIILRYLNNRQITLEINSTKLQKLQIPFFLFFRMFGMANDRDIVEQIVPLADGEQSASHRQIVSTIVNALKLVPPTFEPVKDELDQQRIIEFLGVKLESFVTNPQSYRSEENAVRYLTTRLLSILDRVLLPHVGQSEASRGRKLQFIGMLIRKMLLVHQGVVPSADRDSFISKRVHGPGISIAKSFKAMFNIAIITDLVSNLKTELKNNDFSRITERRIQEAARSMLSASITLNRIMQQSLTSGNKIMIVRRRAMLNRVASHVLERKNTTNVLSSLRAVSVPNASSASKGTERAERVRAVHQSSWNYICCVHSPDTGVGVGMTRQLACTTTVCLAGDKVMLVERLVSNKRDTLPTGHEGSPVFVNGDWVVNCRDPHQFVALYRGLRRQGRGIPPQTTIYHSPDTDEVQFWVDAGRVTRPLLIVDNNVAEFDRASRAGEAGAKFAQNVRLTMADVSDLRLGRLTMNDLIERGVMEYISPEEMENCLVAESLDVLRERRHDFCQQYTHCDVSQAVFGVVALTSPLANHTQPARVCYQTNQGRQTCGWYCFNWPFRADQLRFFQIYNEMPLVKTIAHNFVIPNGLNTITAYMTYLGYGQEDSTIGSQAFIQAGGFDGWLMRRQQTSLAKNEKFGRPDIATTSDIKPASYDHLVDGFVPAGTQVKKGDVLVGKLSRDTRDSASAYRDRSLVHMEGDAVVDFVWRSRNSQNEMTATVGMRFMQPLHVGDKLSSRSGNKCILALALPRSELPFTEDGTVPDLIINPHSIPTRMTVGQLIETQMAMICARRGNIGDGTAFRHHDVAGMLDTLQEMGMRRSAQTRMYSPLTGRHMDAAIFIGPTYHQRLQKFVEMDRYVAPPTGPTDSLTHQPLEGKRQHGGLRIGEMEGWVYAALGAMNSFNEKIRDDSDGCTATYCRRCGYMAARNDAFHIYKCVHCGDSADLTEVASCHSAIVLQHELQSIGIDVKATFEPLYFPE